MNIRLAAAGALVLAIVAWWFWPTDTRRIVAATTQLAEAASIPKSEPDLARVTRAATLARLLAVDVRLVGPSGRAAIDGREAALGLATRLRPPEGLVVSVGEVEVVVEGDGRTATSYTTVTLREPGADGAPDTVDARAVAMSWARNDRWQVTEVTVQEGEER
jgi:ketosteroid isomerase-like protein